MYINKKMSKLNWELNKRYCDMFQQLLRHQTIHSELRKTVSFSIAALWSNNHEILACIILFRKIKFAKNRPLCRTNVT